MTLTYYIHGEASNTPDILQDGKYPLLVLDPFCAVLNCCQRDIQYGWDFKAHDITTFLLQPGHLGALGQRTRYGWDLLAELKQIQGEFPLSAQIVADALIPPDRDGEKLAHDITMYVLLFAIETNWFRDFAEMCNWLASCSIRNLIFFWHCAYQESPHLGYLVSQQITEEAWLAAENVLKKRLHIFKDPGVTMLFTRSGFSLSSICANPRQAVFLAPGINDTLKEERMMLYQFLFRVLRGLAKDQGMPLHCLVPQIKMADGSLHEFFPL